MASLNIRNVPETTIDQLKRLARRRHTSMQAVVVQELVEVARQADNAALFETLSDADVDTSEIVSAIDAERASR